MPEGSQRILFNLEGFFVGRAHSMLWIFMYITPAFGLKPRTENSITWISSAMQTQIIGQKHLTDKHGCVKMYIKGRDMWRVDG